MLNQFTRGNSSSDIAEPGESGFWGTPNDDSDGPKSWDDEVSFLELNRAQQAAKDATSTSSSDNGSTDEPTNDVNEETNESNQDQAAREEAFNSFREEMQQQQAAFLTYIQGMTQNGGQDESDGESASAGTPGMGLVALAIGAVAVVFALTQGDN